MALSGIAEAGCAMSEPTRTYKRESLVVEWRKELCTHCESCITGLPAVFDMSKRPWVNMQGATLDEIREQVAQCPSGALVALEAAP